MLREKMLCMRDKKIECSASFFLRSSLVEVCSTAAVVQTETVSSTVYFVRYAEGGEWVVSWSLVLHALRAIYIYMYMFHHRKHVRFLVCFEVCCIYGDVEIFGGVGVKGEQIWCMR